MGGYWLNPLMILWVLFDKNGNYTIFYNIYVMYSYSSNSVICSLKGEVLTDIDKQC